MALEPKLVDVQVPADPEGVVLVLHGGAARGREAVAVSPTQLSVLRMVPIARDIARAGRGRLAVFRLLNAQRGWDEGGDHTPVRDAAWALDEIAARFDGRRLPTVLVGHSLGGRAALLSVGARGVRGVCALAPWVYPTDVAPGLDGQEVLFVHGTDDRIADPRKSAELARAMSARTHVGYVSVRGGKHAMLGRRRQFDGLAAAFAAATLLGEAPPARSALARVAAGEAQVAV